MAVKKVEHVGIMVSDMNASIAFYRDVIGLEMFSQVEVDNDLTLAFLGFEHAKETVVELVQRKGSSFSEEGRVHHIAFTVDNLEAEIDRLKNQNVTFVNEEISSIPNLSKFIFFYGPDRERIEFFEPLK